MRSLKSTLERVVDAGARLAREAEPRLRAVAEARRSAGTRMRRRRTAAGLASRPAESHPRAPGDATQAPAAEPAGVAPAAERSSAGPQPAAEATAEGPQPAVVAANGARAGADLGVRERGAMRRRLRELRRLREPLLMDAGALATELHRSGRPLPEGLEQRLAELAALDEEARGLAQALGEGSGAVELVSAGVAGRCAACGTLVSTVARYCQGCGGDLTARPPLGRRTELGQPANGEAGAAPAPEAAAAAAVAPPEPGADEAAAASAPPEPGADEAEAAATSAPPEPGADEAAAGEPRWSTLASSAGARIAGASSRARAGVRGGWSRAGAAVRRAGRGMPRRERARWAAVGAVALAALVIAVTVLTSASGEDPAPPSIELGAEPPPGAQPAPGAPAEEPPPAAEQAPAEEPAAGDEAGSPIAGLTAADYDPLGDDTEHPESAPSALDGSPGTTWTTESYEAFNKAGVGLLLETPEALAATALRLETPTEGWALEVYGARGATPESLPAGGWTKLAESAEVESGRIELDGGDRELDRYLIWITALPEGEQSVEIAEAELIG